MGSKVMVVYYSRHGSTGEIAEKISSVIRDAGHSTDVAPLSAAPDPAGCDAVVLGSAVYFGAWPRKVVSYLKAWASRPSNPPLWLFFSGPTGKGDPSAQAMNGRGIPDSRSALIECIKPRGIAFFNGKLEPSGLNFLEKFTTKKVGAPVGDFRDWEAISSWARGVAAAVAEPATTRRRA
jgi:menaquinone-dependent protoporphyrinogen oxidase